MFIERLDKKIWVTGNSENIILLNIIFDSFQKNIIVKE